MPILAGLISSGFAGIVAFFAAYVGKKAAMVAALVVTITALTAALVLAFNGLISALVLTVPPEAGLGLAFLPDNADVCLGILASARLAKWIYDWNVSIARDAVKA